MIDRTKLPGFLQNMPEERLKEIIEADNNSYNFDKAMDKMLHTDKKEQGKKKGKNSIVYSPNLTSISVIINPKELAHWAFIIISVVCFCTHIFELKVKHKFYY